MLIRCESSSDAAAVRAVHTAAFGQPLEADLVDALRDDVLNEVSLVTEVDGVVIGHVLLSRLEVVGGGRSIRAAALGPVAVMPEHQSRGVGSALIRQALDEARTKGIAIVLVLGHPGYYPRFGFSAERARCLVSPYSSHGDAWMVAELTSGSLSVGPATVVYPAPWSMFD